MPSEVSTGRGTVEMKVRIIKADGRVIDVPDEDINVEVIELPDEAQGE